MLTKLLPDQVAKFWDIIKFAVEESLPPIIGENPDKMNRILSSILSGKTQCWASYRRDGENTTFEGIALTKVIYDDASDTRNLLIYTVYAYNISAKESWVDGLLSVVKYAAAQKCSQIVSYTSEPYLVKKAKALGANTDFTFVPFNVADVCKTVANL